MHPRNFGSNLYSRDRTSVRPSTTQVNQSKITQSTSMATQMQLEVFWREIAWPPASCEAETNSQ